MPNQELSEPDLRRAFEDGRFLLHYQPQYAAREQTLVGVEALLRLQGLDGALLLPQHFLGLMEASPLVHEIGLMLFGMACRAAATWPGLTTAINVSPLQFRDPHLPAKLLDAAAKAGVDPSRLEIEITESVLFDNPESAETAIQTLADAGFAIALDDFGTGYSSLGYLLRLPVTKLKLDRSFVVGLPTDVKSVSIVHALIALARALGLKVVAEGVEHAAQAALLRAAGCHIIQGYLYSGPVTEAEIRHLAATGSVTTGSASTGSVMRAIGTG